MTPYNYPEPLQDIERRINHWALLKAETGAAGLDEKMAEIKALLTEKLAELRALPEDPTLRAAEPDDLDAIRALRPAGTRRYWSELPEATYRDRLEGAWLGRCAGNVLGSIVELWDIDKMEAWAEHLGDAFPPADYWSEAERPNELKYETSRRDAFTPAKMDGVPTDDDLIYTQLGMLVLEEYGLDFSVDDVGAAWVKYLPVSPASPVLPNLQAGVPAREAAVVDNPTQFWIIGDIQSDPWGYAAPWLSRESGRTLLAQCRHLQPAQWHLRRYVFLRRYRGRLCPGRSHSGAGSWLERNPDRLRAGARAALGAGNRR